MKSLFLLSLKSHTKISSDTHTVDCIIKAVVQLTGLVLKLTFLCPIWHHLKTFLSHKHHLLVLHLHHPLSTPVANNQLSNDLTSFSLLQNQMLVCR